MIAMQMLVQKDGRKQLVATGAWHEVAIVQILKTKRLHFEAFYWSRCSLQIVDWRIEGV
jgi:hypothetical protein